jgi:hypothetical protein
MYVASGKRFAMNKESFYLSREWRELRFKILVKYGRKCMCCNAKNKVLHVDHIKPVSKYPGLRLTESNLQVLCEDCNLGKSNIYETDFRLKKKIITPIKQSKPDYKEAKWVEAFDKKIMINTVGFFTKGGGASWHLWDGQQTLCRSHQYYRIKPKPSHKFSKEGVDKICHKCSSIALARYSLTNWLEFKDVKIEPVEKTVFLDGKVVKYKTRKKAPALDNSTCISDLT